MISLNPQSKVFVGIEAVDFRKGLLGLKSLCKNYLQKAPDSGALFVFRNKRKDAIKVLCYDGQGYWLMMKRLSKGKFPWWPEGVGRGVNLDYRQFQQIINAAVSNPFSEDWKRLY